MNRHRSGRLLAIGLALGALLALVAAAQAGRSSRARSDPSRTLVALEKTALGSILVDARGRSLYLFEKDRGGISACSSACRKNWPPLTSKATPRAGKGVHQSLLRLAHARNGLRQVTYAGHPLYRFVGDRRAGQTNGEEIEAFGGEWYAVAATGRKAQRDEGATSNPGPSSGYGGYGGS